MAEYTLADILSRFGWELTPRGYTTCPFCEKDTRKKLHVDLKNNRWRCPVCENSGGVIHLFARIHLGMPELPKDKAGRQKVASQLYAFMEGTQLQGKNHAAPKPIMASKVPVANDARLDAVYTAMAELPELQLSSEHNRDLLNRGLTQEAIVRNGYRSLPEKSPLDQAVLDTLLERYRAAGGEELRAKLLPISYRKDRVCFGMYIADRLLAAGHELFGIPGFFRFGSNWCLYYHPGLLIPTRSLEGKTVIWQVRRKKTPKYITLSCGNLPGSVTDSVSRCHFPLGNSPLTPGTGLFITEGPLKADVAICLSQSKNIAFAAIPGINTTKDLLRSLNQIRSTGIQVLYNALDMDRITNPNVQKGSKALKAAILSAGYQFKELYWDKRYASWKYLLLQAVAQSRGIAVTVHPQASVFERLDATTEKLPKEIVQNCFRRGDDCQYWDDRTKGIDDALFTQTIHL